MGQIPLIEQRDILLVPFPFSDQSGNKVRPVIVISHKEFNEHSEDILVVGVTSNISRDKYSLHLSNDDIEGGKLFTQCCIKTENILKIDKELTIKKIGKIRAEKLAATIAMINKIIESDTV